MQTNYLCILIQSCEDWQLTQWCSSHEDLLQLIKFNQQTSQTINPPIRAWVLILQLGEDDYSRGGDTYLREDTYLNILVQWP